MREAVFRLWCAHRYRLWAHTQPALPLPAPLYSCTRAQRDTVFTEYALAQALDQGWEKEWQGLCQGLVVGLMGLTVLALFSGVGAARLVTAFREINLPWALAVLLGVHFLSLFFWLLMQWPSRAPQKPSALARSVLWLAERLSTPLFAPSEASKPSPKATHAAFSALSACLFPHPRGQNLAFALLHGLWAVGLAGALLGLFVFFLFQEHHFVWETTLLSPTGLAQLHTALSWPFGGVGAAPGLADDDLLFAPTLAVAWAYWLMGRVFFWGVLPRFVLAVVYFVRAWRGFQTPALSWGDPVLAQWWAMAHPPSHSLGVLDPDSHPSRPFASSAPRPPTVSEDPAPFIRVVFLEPDPRWWPTTPPPVGAGLPCVLDPPLNTLDAQTQCLARLAKTPSPLLVFINAALTPDRGQLRTLSTLRAQTARLAIAPASACVAVFTDTPPQGETPETGLAEHRRPLWEKSLEKAGLSVFWCTDAQAVSGFLSAHTAFSPAYSPHGHDA